MGFFHENNIGFDYNGDRKLDIVDDIMYEHDLEEERIWEEEEDEDTEREEDELHERYEEYLEEHNLDEDDLDEETFEYEIDEGF